MRRAAFKVRPLVPVRLRPFIHAGPLGMDMVVSTTEAHYETGGEPPANGMQGELAPVGPTQGERPQQGQRQVGPSRGGSGGHNRRRAASPDGVGHTRISGAWASVAVALVLGVGLVDFIVQNTRSVRIEFFSASGSIPVAVALLVAALTGAFLVLAIGVARTTQLRIANRRGRKRARRAESLVPVTDADVPS